MSSYDELENIHILQNRGEFLARKPTRSRVSLVSRLFYGL